jgi:hypothetical protein
MKIRKIILLAAVGLWSAGQIRAVTLTSVPMQGGMVMPMVSYHAAEGRIHVMMPPEIPQLTPLLVSNPSDGFDPLDPWFTALDPSQAGMSFSRRYGFVMDTVTDPLPAGTQIWIRKTSGAAELQLFRYKGTTPKLFEPVFGTAGVTNALYWNGMMFHPVAAAPPGANGCTATFQVFLLDTTTGQEVANSSSGPLTFEWTNLPDGRPTLRCAPGGLVAWPAVTSTNWVLESAATLGEPLWLAVTNAPTVVAGENHVTCPASAGQRFFRLRFVP